MNVDSCSFPLVDVGRSESNRCARSCTADETKQSWFGLVLARTVRLRTRLGRFQLAFAE